MATVNKAMGSTTEGGRDEMVAREEYCAPKLVVVGTVQELTLGATNVGAQDAPASLYRTGGGG